MSAGSAAQDRFYHWRYRAQLETALRIALAAGVTEDEIRALTLSVLSQVRERRSAS